MSGLGQAAALAILLASVAAVQLWLGRSGPSASDSRYALMVGRIAWSAPEARYAVGAPVAVDMILFNTRPDTVSGCAFVVTAAAAGAMAPSAMVDADPVEFRLHRTASDAPLDLAAAVAGPIAANEGLILSGRLSSPLFDEPGWYDVAFRAPCGAADASSAPPTVRTLQIVPAND